MIKKLALLAAVAVLYSAVPAAAQGISVQLGNGDRGYHRDGGYRGEGYRGDGFRRGRAEYVRRDRGYHRGWDRGRRGRTVIIER
ncbi:MAG: hypothetical protein JWR89_267 [Tardiphaga sp.]|jgi:hypothetical protein|uniref:hypothetical protein n=1 Tax=Tardiphaga sp. TaxID=1926292 RepID=UPI0026394B22|nr:hypothetical protein [Tardiphaga sp.]MDB5500365.1 hypothetical protein [Tardiphaga sp.]